MSENTNACLIELEGIELTEEMRHNLEKKIIQATLQELASVDLKGDLLITTLSEKMKSRFPGHVGGKALKFDFQKNQ